MFYKHCLFLYADIDLNILLQGSKDFFFFNFRSLPLEMTPQTFPPPEPRPSPQHYWTSLDCATLCEIIAKYIEQKETKQAVSTNRKQPEPILMLTQSESQSE